MKYFVFLISFFVISMSSQAQIIKKIQKRVEQKVEQRVNQKVDKAIDKGLDEAEGAASGKEKENSKDGNDPAKSSKESGSASGEQKPAGKLEAQPKAFSASSKFDFIPGEKTIVFEDFSQDAIGDFPDKWNTDISGEIVKIDGEEGKWFTITGDGAVHPEFITSIPENSTLEFDVLVTPGFNYYNSPLRISLADLKSPGEFKNYKHGGGLNAIYIEIHPQDPSSNAWGRSAFSSKSNGVTQLSNNKTGIRSFNNKDLNKVHVAIWRQKQRIRVYLGEEKIWDLPRALVEGQELNGIVFSRGRMNKENENYYITNIRLAVGNPDTRNKLISEGKFSTTGINFNVGSAEIKSESHGVIKEIADVLKENAGVKIRIVGHTDNTGNEASNQSLSEKRAASVKDYLIQVFGIDGSRIETSGKGQSEPVGDNSSSEGKAQNRRVEFIKL